MYLLKHLFNYHHQRDATQYSLGFTCDPQVTHCLSRNRIDACLLPSTMLMCSSPLSLCRLIEKCSLGYRMELLVFMAPVCSDVQDISSAEADVKEINVSVDSVLCK